VIIFIRLLLLLRLLRLVIETTSIAVMENSSLSSDVCNDVTASPSPQSGNMSHLVFTVIYGIIGTVGVVDNLFVLSIFVLFIKITDKVHRPIRTRLSLKH